MSTEADQTPGPEASPAVLPTPEEAHGAGTAGRLNWLRAGVLGANDGIVSAAGILVGVGGATASRGPSSPPAWPAWSQATGGDVRPRFDGATIAATGTSRLTASAFERLSPHERRRREARAVVVARA